MVGVMALFAAACSSGSSTAATTIAPPITTAVVQTEPPTTTPATTSTSTTTSSTTTTLPEPTTATTVPAETLIKQAVQDYAVAYHACGSRTSRSATRRRSPPSQGPSRSIVTELATGMARQGLYFSTDLTRLVHRRPESVSVLIGHRGDGESVAYSTPAAVLGPNGPDGLPTVVNDQLRSFRYEYHLYLEDGTLASRREERTGDTLATGTYAARRLALFRPRSAISTCAGSVQAAETGAGSATR